MKRVRRINATTTIFAADDEDMLDMPEEFSEFGDDPISDTLDNIEDKVSDLQDSIDEVQEDEIDIEVDNNIANKYIAECDKCHGVFISAIPESDQLIDKGSGICPLCDSESDQYLKWVVKEVDNSI